jgi:hypothetical protein
MAVAHYLQYFFLVGHMFTAPGMAFSQSSDIEVKICFQGGHGSNPASPTAER